MSDLLIVNGEVIWSGEDLYIVKGNHAVDQEAYLRTICDLGESAFYGDYGSKLFSYLGKPDTSANRAFIEAEAKEALLKTKGIKKVLQVSFRQILIDQTWYPFIYAKYQYEGSEETVENTFKFLV